MLAFSYLPAAKKFVEESPKPVYYPGSERFSFDGRQRVSSLRIPNTNKLLLGPMVINTEGLPLLGYVSSFTISQEGEVLLASVLNHVYDSDYADFHTAVVIHTTDSDIPGMVAKCMYNHAKAKAWKSAVAKVDSVWSSAVANVGSVWSSAKRVFGSVSRFIHNAPRKVLNKVPLFQSKKTRSAIQKKRVDTFATKHFRQIPMNEETDSDDNLS